MSEQANEGAGLEAILAAHQRVLDGPGSCWCGEWPPEAHDVPWTAHVAAAVREWLSGALAGHEVVEAVGSAITLSVLEHGFVNTPRVPEAALTAVRGALGMGNDDEGDVR